MRLRYWLILPLIVGCETPYDPLIDYEEVEPTTVLEAPAASIESDGEPMAQRVRRGAYLIELLGCGTCHTDGALIGEPNSAMALAGSRIGIAYTNPLDGTHPGVVYPANLTPDVDTGIGAWTERDIAVAILHGVDREGRGQTDVMPWRSYSKLAYSDVAAIALYLRSLEPVSHDVPESVPPGVPATESYVHFGVYRSKDLW